MIAASSQMIAASAPSLGSAKSLRTVRALDRAFGLAQAMSMRPCARSARALEKYSSRWGQGGRGGDG